MIEIFKTNLNKIDESDRLKKELTEVLPSASIHIDLEDCDKVLKVHNNGQDFDPMQVIALAESMGFYCEKMED